MATFPKDDIKKILDSLCKTNFEKVRDKNTFMVSCFLISNPIFMRIL